MRRRQKQVATDQYTRGSSQTGERRAAIEATIETRKQAASWPAVGVDPILECAVNTFNWKSRSVAGLTKGEGAATFPLLLLSVFAPVVAGFKPSGR